MAMSLQVGDIIRIPDDDAEKMQTFGQAVKYIQGKIAK